jgi:hypothetical protein
MASLPNSPDLIPQGGTFGEFSARDITLYTVIQLDLEITEVITWLNGTSSGSAA